MPLIRDANKDIKDMRVAGCRVQLAFHQPEVGKWRVQGTVKCGLEEQSGEQSFVTASYPSREKAEEEALKQATDLLGNNVNQEDRPSPNRSQ